MYGEAWIAQSVWRRAGRLRFDSWWKQETFLYSTASRPALGPTQPLIEWVPGAISPTVNRPGREADHSPPSGAEVKNCGTIPRFPPISLGRGA
jgi:hypothetical protein